MKRLLTFLLALFAVSAVADIIPPDSQATNIWKIAGIPGGIPTTRTVYSNLSPGGTNIISTTEG